VLQAFKVMVFLGFYRFSVLGLVFFLCVLGLSIYDLGLHRGFEFLRGFKGLVFVRVFHGLGFWA